MDKKTISFEKNYGQNSIKKYYYDIKHIGFDIEINPSLREIKGSVAYLLKITQNTDTLFFNCNDSLYIDSITYLNTSIFFTHYNKVLRVFNNNTFIKDDTVRLKIFYHGIPISTGFGSFEQGYHDSVPIIWTLSQPYGAQDWFPCKMTLNDKIDSMDMIIHTPEPNIAASNGVLIDSIYNNGIITYHWQHKYPIETYLIAFSVTNYKHFRYYFINDTDSFPIDNYTFPESYAEVITKQQEHLEVMQLFDSLFIPYPFAKEKYGNAEMMKGGGMEHQTITFLSDLTNFEIYAHELAHQWFGDYITCGSWQEIWLNEAFATYCSGICYEHMFNGIYWKKWKRISVNAIITEPDGSIFVKDTSNIESIFDVRLSYRKASYFLHTIRWVIGDSAFYSGCKSYLNDSNLIYGYSNSNNLKTHFEIKSDTCLTDLFNDWLYNEGYPMYTIKWKQNDNNEIFVCVHQSTSHPSVSFFKLPISITLKNHNQDTTIRINNTYNHQCFNITIDFKADSLIFDNDINIISANNKVIKSESDNLFNCYYSNNTIYVQLFENYNFGTIEIYNLKGEKISNYELRSNSINIRINTINYSSGIYIIKATTDNNIYTQKLFIF